MYGIMKKGLVGLTSILIAGSVLALPKLEIQKIQFQRNNTYPWNWKNITHSNYDSIIETGETLHFKIKVKNVGDMAGFDGALFVSSPAFDHSDDSAMFPLSEVNGVWLSTKYVYTVGEDDIWFPNHNYPAGKWDPCEKTLLRVGTDSDNDSELWAKGRSVDILFDLIPDENLIPRGNSKIDLLIKTSIGYTDWANERKYYIYPEDDDNINHEAWDQQGEECFLRTFNLQVDDVDPDIQVISDELTVSPEAPVENEGTFKATMRLFVDAAGQSLPSVTGKLLINGEVVATRTFPLTKGEEADYTIQASKINVGEGDRKVEFIMDADGLVKRVSQSKLVHFNEKLKADLYLEDNDVIVTSDYKDKQGRIINGMPITVYYSIENTGDIDARNCKVKIYHYGEGESAVTDTRISTLKPGQIKDRTVKGLVKQPPVSETSCKIVLVADPDDNIEEYVETIGNVLTVDYPVVPPSRDLCIELMDINPDTLKEGNAFEVEVFVENKGNLESGKQDVILYLDGKPFSTKYVSSLDPGSGKLVTFTKCYFSDPGDHRVDVRVSDPEHDPDLFNNEIQRDVTVEPKVRDGAINSVIISPEEPVQGDTVRITVDVINSGEVDLNWEWIDVALTVDGSTKGVEMSNRRNSGTGLRIGQSTKYYFYVDRRFTTGNHNWNADLTVTGDADLSNNSQNGSFNVAESQKPDFVITAMSIDSATPVAGRDLIGEVTIRNNGEASGSPKTVRIYHEGQEAQSVTLRCTRVLSGGAETTINISGLPVQKGDVRLVAVADPDDEIWESDETNNTFFIDYTGGDPIMDVALTSLEVSPDSVPENSSFNADVIVENTGTEPADAGNLQAYLDGNPVGNPMKVPRLTPGQVRTFRMTRLPVNVTAGQHIVSVKVDSDDTLVENDEQNNTLQTNLTVTEAPKPDFIIQGMNLIPTNPVAGRTISLEIVVENIGDASGNPYTVRICRQGDEANFIDIRVPTLQAGQQKTVSAKNKLAAVSGNTVLLAEIDPDNLTAEWDETNNGFQLPYIGIDPIVDVAATLIVVDPDSVPENSTFNAVVTVENTGTEVVDAGYLQAYLDGNPVGNPMKLSRLNAGQVKAVPMNRLPANVLMGQHIVSAKVDCDNSLDENDELNNTCQTNLTVTEAPKPDLEIVGFEFNPGIPTEGLSMGGYLTVINNGEVTAPPCYVDFWFTQPVDPENPDYSLKLPSIPAGKTTRKTVSRLVAPAAGDQVLTIITDTENNILEEDETNNIYISDYTVSEYGFDLTCNVLETSTELEQGEKPYAKLEIINLGAASVPTPVAVSVFLSYEGNPFEKVMESTVGTLRGYQKRLFTIKPDAPETVIGTYDVFFEVSPVQDDLNPENNISVTNRYVVTEKAPVLSSVVNKGLDGLTVSLQVKCSDNSQRVAVMENAWDAGNAQWIDISDVEPLSGYITCMIDFNLEPVIGTHPLFIGVSGETMISNIKQLNVTISGGKLTVTPATGQVPGQEITISGTAFGSEGTVTIGGVAAEILEWTPIMIRCIVPEDASSGEIRITPVDGLAQVLAGYNVYPRVDGLWSGTFTLPDGVQKGSLYIVPKDGQYVVIIDNDLVGYSTVIKPGEVQFRVADVYDEWDVVWGSEYDAYSKLEPFFTLIFRYTKTGGVSTAVATTTIAGWGTVRLDLVQDIVGVNVSWPIAIIEAEYNENGEWNEIDGLLLMEPSNSGLVTASVEGYGNVFKPATMPVGCPFVPCCLYNDFDPGDTLRIYVDGQQVHSFVMPAKPSFGCTLYSHKNGDILNRSVNNTFRFACNADPAEYISDFWVEDLDTWDNIYESSATISSGTVSATIPAGTLSAVKAYEMCLEVMPVYYPLNGITRSLKSYLIFDQLEVFLEEDWDWDWNWN